jgi:hypothetical protein
MKTIQDYLNDPRILNDPCMAGALEPVKEIHAIRLKLQDMPEWRRKKRDYAIRGR